MTLTCAITTCLQYRRWHQRVGTEYLYCLSHSCRKSGCQFPTNEPQNKRFCETHAVEEARLLREKRQRQKDVDDTLTGLMELGQEDVILSAEIGVGIKNEDVVEARGKRNTGKTDDQPDSKKLKTDVSPGQLHVHDAESEGKEEEKPWDDDHPSIVSNGHVLIKNILTVQQTERVTKYLLPGVEKLFVHDQIGGIIHPLDYEADVAPDQKEGQSKAIYVSFPTSKKGKNKRPGDEPSAKATPSITIASLERQNPGLAAIIRELRHTMKVKLGLKRAPWLVGIVATPPGADSQNWHLDSWAMWNGVIIPIRSKQAHTEFMLVRGYKSQKYGSDEWYDSLINGEDWNNPTRGYLSYDVDLGDCILFNTAFPHRGPANNSAEWRFSVFMAWPVCKEAEDSKSDPQTTTFHNQFSRYYDTTSSTNASSSSTVSPMSSMSSNSSQESPISSISSSSAVTSIPSVITRASSKLLTKGVQKVSTLVEKEASVPGEEVGDRK